MRSAIPLALAFLLLASGCMGTRPAGPADTAGGQAAGPSATAAADAPSTGPAAGGVPAPGAAANSSVVPRVLSYKVQGTMLAAAADGEGAPTPESEGNLIGFLLDAQTVQVEATLTFSSPDGAQDLDVAVSAPGADRLCVPAAGHEACNDDFNFAGMLPPGTPGMPAGWFVNGGGMPGSPDSPSRLVLGPTVVAKDCAEGTLPSCHWKAHIYSHVPVLVDTAYTLQVNVTTLSPVGPDWCLFNTCP